MKKTYKKLSAIVSTTCLIPLNNIAFAATPSCESLGYNMSSDRCKGEAVKCPFDSSKVYCIRNSGAKTCTESSCSSTPVTSAQTCDQMGYTMKADDCASDSSYIKCPFDLSKLYCIKKSPTCEDHGYFTNIPKGKECYSSSLDDDLTCYYDCKVTCAAHGWQKSEPKKMYCPTSMSLDDGTICYTDCQADTCTRHGLFDSQPSGAKCTTTTENGLSCYKCEDTCESKGYYSKEPVGESCRSVSFDDLSCFDPKQCTTVGTCASNKYLMYKPEGQKCTTVNLGGETCYRNCSVYTEGECYNMYKQYIFNDHCDNNCHASSDYFDSRIPDYCRKNSLVSCTCSSYH